jgi:hypothetical protein
MRPDIVPGALFPDYRLSDHTAKRRKLSDLQRPLGLDDIGAKDDPRNNRS